MGILVVFALIVAQPGYWDEEFDLLEYGKPPQSNPHGTGAGRIYAWTLGWKMFLDNPFIGVGQGNYPWRLGRNRRYAGYEHGKHDRQGEERLDSLYFTLLPELGLIGTLLYVLMIFYSFKDLQYIKNVSKKTEKILLPDVYSKKVYYLALAIEASLIGYFVSSVFISTLYYPIFWLFCGFIVSLKKIVYSKNRETSS